MAGTEATRPEASGSASPGAGGTLAACRRMAEQQDVALGAAAVTLDDWQIHLGAMNKFAAGVVTVDELEGFWEQTEVQAAGGIRAFRAAARELDGATGDCPPPGKRMRTAALRDCAEDVSSRGRALRAARTAADERFGQQQQMRGVRAWETSEAAARAGWLRIRGTSIGELEDYQRAARARPRPHGLHELSRTGQGRHRRCRVAGRILQRHAAGIPPSLTGRRQGVQRRWRVAEAPGSRISWRRGLGPSLLPVCGLRRPARQDGGHGAPGPS